jgi:uncharacterized protein Usg
MYEMALRASRGLAALFLHECQDAEIVAKCGKVTLRERELAEKITPSVSHVRKDLDRMVTTDFQRQIDGFGLTTADILYRLPDHPKILQQYVWQEYDKAPSFPELNRFLMFWQAKLEGLLFRVTVCHRALIGPAELKPIDGEFRLN